MAKDLQEDTDKDYIRLHVGGLSADVTDKDLRDRFSSFGKITSIDVVKGYDCACRGFAYINFDKSADVKKCISVLDRTRWRGNLMTIQRANAGYMERRNAELEARRKREQETKEKLKEASATIEENAASKDKAGLWVVNKHGSVLPVLRITNNNNKIVKINPNKYKNAVKRLAADSSGEEEPYFRDDDVGEAPKKISEDIEIIHEDQMEVDEEETPATKGGVGYPFSDDEDDRNYESRGEDDDAPVPLPANIQVEKKSALSILEQMFPEEKEFIRKKDAKMEKTRAIELKETGPIGPGVKEALAKIEAKKAAEKAAATKQAQVTKVEPAKEVKAKEAEKKPVAEPIKEVKAKEEKKPAVEPVKAKEPAKEVKTKETEQKPVEESAKEVKAKETKKKPVAEPVKETKEVVVEPAKEVKTKEVEKKPVTEPVKEVKVKEVVVEKKSEPAPQPTVNTKKRSREESSSSESDNEEESGDDSSSTTSSASSSTDFFESIKRRKIMESQQGYQAPPEKKKIKKEENTKINPVAVEQPQAKIEVEETAQAKKVEEKEESSSSSSDDEEGSDSDSDSSSTTSSASSSTEFFEEIRRRKAMEQQAKDEKQAAKEKKKAAKKAKKEAALVTTTATPTAPVAYFTPVPPVETAPVVPTTTTTVPQSMQVDEENGKSWVDIMTQYETERLKPVTILAPKAVWKLFPDRDDNTTAAPMAMTSGGNAMEIESTAEKPDEEKVDIGVASKDYKPFFPFIGNSEKLIGDTLVRTKTLEEIEDEWRREKVFLTQDYKKKQSIAVKKRRKLEKKQR